MPLRSRPSAVGLFLALSSLSTLTTGCQLQRPPTTAAAPVVLPLRALRLYETGVGYFERTGTVSGGEQALPVPAGHLDDALKSLVIVGGDPGVEITGVQFASNTSKGFARAAAGLPSQEGPIAYRDVLASLRGASLTITLVDRSQAPIRGRLVDLEDEPIAEGPRKANKPDGKEGETKEAPPMEKGITLTILGHGGHLLRVATRDVAAVLPDEPALVKRLGAALDVLSTRNAQTPRLLRLRAKTNAPVTFGYIAETPIWRTSYRLVLDKTGVGATLQSWALVHNDTDEDWRGVTLSLVNGRPDSFLFPLAAPRYGRRPLVHPDTKLSTVPQLLDTTVDSMWSDTADIGAGGLGLSGVGEGGGGRGEGIGLGSVGTIGGESTLLSVGDLSAVQNAATQEGTTQFTYTARTPLDLAAHSSGLVPLLSSKVEIEPVAFFEDPQRTARAALRFTNTTGQTLPGGTIAIFEGGGFAGESAIDRLKPGEARMIGFGQDLDVAITDYREAVTNEPKRLTWDGRTLGEHFLRTRKVSFELENRSGRDRSVVVRFALHRNAKVEGVDGVRIDPVSETPQLLFKAASKTKLPRPFTAVEGLEHRYEPARITREIVDRLIAAETVPAAERAALKDVATKVSALTEATQAAAKGAQEIARIEKDIERLREHVKSSKEGAAPGRGDPLVKRLVAAEDALDTARTRVERAQAELGPKEKALRETLEKLPKPSTP